LRHDADAGPRCLGVVGDGVAVEHDFATIRPGQAKAEAQRRRFAGAVRAEQAKAGAGLDGERQTGDNFAVAVGLAQIAGGQCRHALVMMSRIRCRRRWKK